MDKQKLEAFIRDIKKIYEAEKALKGLEIMENITGNTSTVIDYALSKKIISSLEDVIYVIKQVPEIEDVLVTRIYMYKDRGSLVKAEPKIEYKTEYKTTPYQHNGMGYNSLKDVPGYGTQWNERCVPDDVYVNRDRNNRC
jgi:hypothetical protein